MRWIALAAYPLIAALWLAGAGASTQAASLRALSLRVPFPVARLATVTCDGQPAALLEAKDGTRHRVIVAAGLLALEQWHNCPLPDPAVRPETMADSVVTMGSGEIAAAWLAVPTLKYRHGVLGDVVEAQEVRVSNRLGETVRYRVDDNSVFEDRLARIAYVNRKDALLVVRTRLDKGAALAMFTLADGAGPSQRLVLAAESAPIGQPNRWLNPIGAEDFDGDGRSEIAAVLTPHKGGTLVIYGQEGARLTAKYRAPGFSNHEIFSRELGMAGILDVDGNGIPDLLVPDATRETLRVVTFAHGSFTQLFRTARAAPVVSAVSVARLRDNGKLEAAWVLEDGTVMALVR